MLPRWAIVGRCGRGRVLPEPRPCPPFLPAENKRTLWNLVHPEREIFRHTISTHWAGFGPLSFCDRGQCPSSRPKTSVQCGFSRLPARELFMQSLIGRAPARPLFAECSRTLMAYAPGRRSARAVDIVAGRHTLDPDGGTAALYWLCVPDHVCAAARPLPLTRKIAYIGWASIPACLPGQQ